MKKAAFILILLMAPVFAFALRGIGKDNQSISGDGAGRDDERELSICGKTLRYCA